MSLKIKILSSHSLGLVTNLTKFLDYITNNSSILKYLINKCHNFFPIVNISWFLLEDIDALLHDSLSKYI